MSFEDIKGKDKVFSSYLFVGPDGPGKLLAAKNFAKTLNCLGDERTRPCEECTSCRKINSGSHPDLFLVEPGEASSIGINQIRDVIQKANLKPYEARKKVFIIKDAHSMNAASSNAFLKTLEEPPEDNIFILISRSKDILLSTIVSRCYIVGFEERAKEKEKDLTMRKKMVIDSLEIGTYSNKEELKENLEFLVSFYRDIFIYKTVRNEAMIFHVDRIDKIKRECDRFTLDELDYLIKRIITLRSYIDYNVNPKIIVDVLANELQKFTSRI